MNSQNSVLWHSVEFNEALRDLSTDPQKGLSAGDVEQRRSQYGANVLTKKKGAGALVRFLMQFSQPLVYILIAASLVTLILQEYVDSAVIFLVVLVNAIVGFIQEAKALKSLDALSKTMTTPATVLREGKEIRIPSEELVPGDIVLLSSGDKVSADLRLISIKDIQINESALTGESLPVQKNIDVLSGGESLADRKNMAYASTLVTYGKARGVVVATGDNTEIGRISQLIQNADNLQTPLTIKIGKFSHMLLWVILAVSFITFLVGVLRGQNAVEMFMAAVAMAVGAIPEGLPAALTITLAIGVSRMAKRRAIIRKLPAVETLGSTTVICSDKTGTLTKNEMTVQFVHTLAGAYEFKGAGYQSSGDILFNGASIDVKNESILHECLLAGVLCNDSRLESGENGVFVEGDPTEGALIVSALKAGIKHSEAAGYRMEPGCALRSAISQAIRRVSTRVLPDPAPATTSSGAPEWDTAARCGWLSPSSSSSGEGMRRRVAGPSAPASGARSVSVRTGGWGIGNNVLMSAPAYVPSATQQTRRRVRLSARRPRRRCPARSDPAGRGTARSAPRASSGSQRRAPRSPARPRA